MWDICNWIRLRGNQGERNTGEKDQQKDTDAYTQTERKTKKQLNRKKNINRKKECKQESLGMMKKEKNQIYASLIFMHFDWLRQNFNQSESSKPAKA